MLVSRDLSNNLKLEYKVSPHPLDFNPFKIKKFSDLRAILIPTL